VWDTTDDDLVAGAYRALDGVGDPGLGEWLDAPVPFGGGVVVHLRRRCTPGEAEQFGLDLRDVRGTEEAVRRLMALPPQVRAMIPQAILEAEVL
jgi:hypothetical protein